MARQVVAHRVEDSQALPIPRPNAHADVGRSLGPDANVVGVRRGIEGSNGEASGRAAGAESEDTGLWLALERFGCLEDDQLAEVDPVDLKGIAAGAGQNRDGRAIAPAIGLLR